MALSLASLVLLSFGVVALMFSLPVTDEWAAANAAASDAPPAGVRAVIQPLVNPATVDTLDDDGKAAWLVIADRPGMAPAMAEDAKLVEALAFASALHDGSYANATVTLSNLSAMNGSTVETFNATVEMGPLGQGRSGFLVKGASERDIVFVPTTNVVGAVVQFESSAWSYGLIALGLVGFVGPLVVLIVTARPRGARPTTAPAKDGKAGFARSATPGAACPECRKPLLFQAEFCTSCGAWLPRAPPAPSADEEKARS